MVVRKVKGKYYVYSKTKHKRLSKGYRTRKAALKRLREIEYFKHRK